MTISEINQKCAELKAQRSALVNKKAVIIQELSGINGACVHTLGRMDYEEKQVRRGTLVGAMQGIEQQISDLNAEISRTGATTPSDKKPTGVDVTAQRPIVQELVELRDYYETFAADATRVSSTRIMAAEFTGKLTQIIRHAMAHAK